ncbi:MAG: DNA methyltransferase [Gemmatimonadota bacterium]|nr:DNA methyltransferase [Gemmatimonadota bacterium]
MNSASVDLIATDPPFNKGRDFHATPDSLAAGAKFQDRWSWERDVHEEWTDQITDDHPRLMEAIESARYAHSDGMGAYMCFMAVRLLELHRVLKPTGSIYLHCDPTASHYLKAVLDAIFGWKQFRNEIVWTYRTGGAGRRTFGRKHDLILWFSKGSGWTFNVQKERSYLTGQMGHRKSDKTFTDEHGTYQEIVFSKTEIKLYKDERGYYTMVNCRDYWPIDAVGRSSAERSGYPTQKPLALLDRIIRASSNEGDIVCDPFAGCATTLVSAEQLGRQWVGMDIWDGAHRLVVDRLKDTTGLFGNVTYEMKPPKRTDDGETSAPFLRVKQRVKEPDGPRWTRSAMYEHLLEQHGPRCQGCDRVFDDPRYLELDHNIPRSDGGINHVTNRILLCGPCNKLKSNIYTLSGLRRENNRRGYMR